MTNRTWGCLPRETIAGVNGLFRCASDAGIQPLPRSKWRDWDISAAVGEIYDQGSTGTCVGQCTAKAVEIATRLTGATVGSLNGFAVYRLAYLNSRRVPWGAGLSLEAGLSVVQKYGAPEVSANWPAKASPMLPDDWKALCGKHAVLELTDYDGDSDDILAMIVTLGMQGWPSVLGTGAWGGGHCVCCTWGYWEGSTYRFGGPNSWGEDSKTNTKRPGFWTWPEKKLGDVDQRGCWGCRVTTG